MANFSVKTKNEANIDKKPRVYFTCHPDDFEKHFSKIWEDIFKTHDCAIYYTADMTEVIPEDERELDLGRQNLFVVPVTFKLLSRPNRAMDEDIPYALQNRIPVLPIMMEPELDAIYSRADRFGELQYLNPNSRDLTEIPYEEKLRKYLNSVLISDDLAWRVRKAFDAYIFLSYRKKDRIYANELMRLIHKNPECRDIAIWFDEFLTPGESFRENIETMLNNSELFTLLVTPQLLEKVVDEHGVERDNYVVSTELPLARRKKETGGTEILAVEMESTDRNALAAINITDYVDSEDEAFRSRLLETLYKDATTKDDSPEHNYLIGLAYLDGIDVEVDRERGLELITAAAEAGLLEAMVELKYLYGILGNYLYECEWAHRIVEYYTERDGLLHLNTIVAMNNVAIALDKAGEAELALKQSNLAYQICDITLEKDDPTFINVKNTLAHVLVKCGRYQDASGYSREVYDFYFEKMGKDDYQTIVALNNYASLCLLQGKYQDAESLFKNVVSQSCRFLSEDDPNAVMMLQNMALSYKKCGKYHRALELYNRAYVISCKNSREYHPNTIIILHNRALVRRDLCDYQNALLESEDAYRLSCEILGEEHPATLVIGVGLATILYMLDKYQESINLLEQTYSRFCNVLNEEHPDTLSALHNLAVAYHRSGDYRKALKHGKKAYRQRCAKIKKEHPDTMATQLNLADTYYAMGEYNKACELFEEVYCQRCRDLGEDHTDTFAARERRDAARRALEECNKASKNPSNLRSKKKK